MTFSFFFLFLFAFLYIIASWAGVRRGLRFMSPFCSGEPWALYSTLGRLQTWGFDGQTQCSGRHIPHAARGAWTLVDARGSFITYGVEHSSLKRESYARMERETYSLWATVFQLMVNNIDTILKQTSKAFQQAKLSTQSSPKWPPKLSLIIMINTVN